MTTTSAPPAPEKCQHCGGKNFLVVRTTKSTKDGPQEVSEKVPCMYCARGSGRKGFIAK